MLGGLADDADAGLQKLNDVIDDGADSVRRGVDELADDARDGLERAGQLADEARQGVRDGVDDLKDSVDEAKRDAQNFAEGAKAAIAGKAEQAEATYERAKDGVRETGEAVAEGAKQTLEAGIDDAENLAVETTNQAEKSLKSGVQDAQVAVRAGEQTLKAKLDQQRARLEDPQLPAPVEAPLDEAVDFASKVQEQTGITLEDYPREEVAELCEKYVDGDLPLGEAVLELSRIHTLAQSELESDLGAIGLEVAEEAAQGVQHFRDEIEGVVDGPRAMLDNPVASAIVAQNPTLIATRTASLELLETAGNMPEIADQFVANKDDIRKYIDAGSIGRATAQLEDLPENETFERGSKIVPGAAAGGGAEVPISAHAVVEPTGEDTYQVTLEASGGLSGILGEKAVEGGYGKAGADLSRKVVFEVSGPNAARDAAILATGDVSSPTNLSLLSEEPKIISGNFELGVALGGDLTGLGVDTDLGHMTGFRREDDAIVLEKQLSAQLSGGYQTPVYVQLSDELESAFEQGENHQIGDNAHPAVRRIMDELPDGMIEDIKEAHGDSVGTSFGFEAGGSAKYSYNTETGTHGLTLQTRGQVHAGKTTYEVSHTVNIEDVEAFEETLSQIGDESLDLVGSARRGEVSTEEILDVIHQHPDMFAASVDFETKVERSRDNLDHAAIGDNEVYSGTVEHETLFRVTDDDIIRAFDGITESLRDDDDEDLSAQITAAKLSARRKQ